MSKPEGALEQQGSLGMAIRRRWAIAQALALGLDTAVATGGAAMANPDVWVKVKYLISFDDTSLTALKVDWTFDAFLSSHALSQFDLNEDRTFDDGETQALRAALFDPLADKNFFVRLFTDDVRQATRLESFAPRVEDDRLGFTFTLVPEAPLAYRGAPTAIGLYDDEIFFDFTLADADFLRVDGPFDPSCRFRIQDGVGPLDGVPQTVVLLCSE